MSKIALLFAMLVSMPMITACSASEQVPEAPVVKQQLLGSPVYIQIFKEERKLELYAKMGNEFRPSTRSRSVISPAGWVLNVVKAILKVRKAFIALTRTI